MGILDNIFKAINDATGITENQPRNLDGRLPSDPSTVTSFGALGDFSNQIDKSAERQYVETGYIRNVRPRESEKILQEPDITILVKKRMFGSLAENFKPELMDQQEKLFYRASKRLFQNKCNAIAAYERLSKIDRVVANDGVMHDYLFPIVLNSFDTLSELGVNFNSQTQGTLETLRKVKVLSDPNYRTTWITESELPGRGDLGDGTGVMEFTNVTSATCTTSVNFGQGNGSFVFDDPYKLMLITSEDIEKAIRESVGGFLQNSFFKMTEVQLEDTIKQLREQLNSVRAARGATGIRFFINEDSLLFRKVRAVIDEEGREILFNYDGGLAGIGSDVQVDDSALQGTNGLDSETSELEIFKQVLKNIYILMGIKKSTQTHSFQFNKETNYVRRKMMLHFHKKCIIQPMDSIHVYCSTKTSVDSKSAGIIANSFGAETILKSINDTIEGIDDMLDSFNGNGDNQGYAVIEKNAIAGEEFPMWLWNIMRNDFTKQGAGTHIFAGLVERSVHDYSGGRYVMNVSAQDHCKYFRLGQLNVSPSVEVFNSALYDPLTPRELNIDPSSGFLRGEDPPLLQENIKLLNSGLLKFKNGRFRGYPASEQIYNSFDIEKIKNSSNRYSVRRKYEDPDGLVYRWKEGIQTLTLLGEPHPTAEQPSDSAPSLTNKPFAGQDVMNVLSLLITGIPYNFNTFVKAAINSGALSRDDLINESGAKSFFRGLLSDVSKQNATWGNFVPFKKLVVNQSAYNFLRSGQFDAVTQNSKLTELLRKRAQAFDLLVKSSVGFANNPHFLNVDINGNLTGPVQDIANNIITSSDPIALSKLTADIASFDLEIEQTKKAFEDSIKNPNINTSEGSISIFGDDITFDPTVTNGGNYITEEDVARERNEFRKKLNNLTQRRLWKVKGNVDQNLFIVDDQYDKNYDIQAFEKSLAGTLELFNSAYFSPEQQITMVASILGLEIFADSQGHIQARPPQYNRMPSSVFYKMIQTKDLTGVQLFPSYLESLFTNQIKGLSDSIEIAEEEIRIRAAALGYTTDQAAKNLLSGMIAGGGSTAFAFCTSEIDGKFGGQDVRIFLGQVDPDASGNETSTALKSRGNALNELAKTIDGAKAGVNFDIIQRVKVVNGETFGGKFGASENDINNKIEIIRKRLESKTGRPGPTKQSLLSTENIASDHGRSQSDVLNLTQQIAQFLSQRQASMKMMANAIRSLGDGIEINTSDEPGRTALQPYLNKTKSLPEILEHMIEDEDEDDLGANSGKRFIIRDNQIISLQLIEEPPGHTAVEVTGLFGEGLASPPGGLDTGGGGNAISTAWAVDFDMWRMYGFKPPMTVQAPFLSNPDTQCAPYAVALLNKARKEIFQCQTVLAGNEFLQPGEVYYIEDYDLLFYSESVTHSFNYGSSGGGSYTTSMNLKYGHSPGEYIPTILDIVGKGLYTNRNQAELARHNRHGNANGDVHVGVVVFDNPSFAGDPVKALVSGPYGDQNRKNLGNVLLAVTGAMTPATLNKKAVIELRTYFDSRTSSADSYLVSVANGIKSWVINPVQVDITGEGFLPDWQSNGNGGTVENDIVIKSVDLNKNDYRSPSQAAVNKAREVAATSGQLPVETTIDTDEVDNDLRPTMFAKIIDIWLTFTDQVPSIDGTQTQQQNQAAQQNLAKATAALDARVKE